VPDGGTGVLSTPSTLSNRRTLLFGSFTSSMILHEGTPAAASHTTCLSRLAVRALFRSLATLHHLSLLRLSRSSLFKIRRSRSLYPRVYVVAGFVALWFPSRLGMRYPSFTSHIDDIDRDEVMVKHVP
jgi:hypothetical protein